jgi:hypothetical protein
LTWGAERAEAVWPWLSLVDLNVTLVDFADNCLDEDIRPMLETQAHALRFVEHDLTEPLTQGATYGFCTDVLRAYSNRGCGQGSG